MDPEKIEIKIKELNDKIASEVKKGQLKIQTINRFQKELNEDAHKIMGWKQKIEAFEEVLK